MRKIFLLIFLAPVLLKAQYGMSLLGIGAFMSATESVHYYRNKDMGKREEFAANYATHPEYYYPRDYIGRESFSVLSGGVFAEFGRGGGARWQTEVEWMKKSINSRDVADPISGAMTGFSKRKYKYIQWNNYLKFYNPIGYLSAWYFMPGIRLEYLFSAGGGPYGAYDGNFAKIWFSGNVGAGYEFGITKKIFMFTEYHWIPEILSHRFDNVRVRNRTFELRVGLVYRPKKKSIDDCNAPKYKGRLIKIKIW